MKLELTRNYLKAEEMAVIVVEMLKQEEEFSRQMMKYSLTAQLLLNGIDASEDKNSSDIYNQVIESGIDLDEAVINLWLVDKIVRQETDTPKVIEKMLNGVVNKINEAIDNVDPKALLVELNKLQNGVNDITPEK